MKKTALIVAVEMFAVFEKWGEPDKKYDGLPFKSCSYERYGDIIYVVRSGPGQNAAHDAAAMAADKFGVTELWNFGVVGSLNHELNIGDICVVQETVRWDVQGKQDIFYQSDTSLCEYASFECISLLDDKYAVTPDGSHSLLKVFKVRCASGDSVVAEREERIAVAELTGAHIVDMEAAGIAEAAAERNLFLGMVKCISDDLNTDISGLTDAFRPTALRAFEAFDCIYNQNALKEKAELPAGTREKGIFVYSHTQLF